jgi:carbonic anhydrase/acetyltransferase-like protein (isoleucine patch superfamily)
MFDPVNTDLSLEKVHESVFIAPTATVIGDVTIGAGSSIWYGSVVRGDLDAIVIGEGTNIQDNCVVHVDRDAPTRIGNNVVVGHAAIVHSATIGDGALIGMGAILQVGCVIGAGAIIGAGAVVTENKEIPPDVVAVGIPARVLREITPAQKAETIENARQYAHRAEMHKKAWAERRGEG